MKTARFVLSCRSVGTSLPEIALSAWMSASSFAGYPRSAFTLTRNVAAPAVVLFRSSSIAPSKMSASGAPTNVTFPPSPTHLFTAFSSAWLSHKYSMGVVTGVPRNAKTMAARTVRAGSFLFASHLSLLPFPFFSQVHITCSHFPPFLVRSITRCDCASEAVTS